MAGEPDGTSGSHNRSAGGARRAQHVFGAPIPYCQPAKTNGTTRAICQNFALRAAARADNSVWREHRRDDVARGAIVNMCRDGL